MPSCFLSWFFTKLLLVASFLLLFYSPANSQYTKAPTFQFEGTIPGTDPLPLIRMSPGNTKRLSITLKGRIDMITLTFQEDPYEVDSFNLFIKNNNQMESTQTAKFPSEEYLTLDLDPSRNLLVVQGDKGFRISKFVREKEYDVQVRGYERSTTDSDVMQDMQRTSADNPKAESGGERTTAYFILAGVIGGLFGLVILIKGGSVLVKKVRQRLRKSSSVFSVNSRSSNKIRDGDLEAGGATPVLAFDNHIYAPDYKNSLTLDEKGVLENENESVHQQYQKKEFPSSLTSIESGTGKSTIASTTSLISSSGSLQNIAAKKGHKLEAITEEASYVKPVLPLGPLKVPPLKLEELNSKRRNSYCGRKLTNSKILPAPVRGQPVAKTMIELSNHKSKNQSQKENRIDYESNKPDKKVITMKDIRKLVDRVMREKQFEDNSVDASDESSNKDGGGDTPNYYMCLVCYKEKRSAVAEPCGHVFGCMNCTKRVLNCSKGCCALCHQKIKGYHALKG